MASADRALTAGAASASRANIPSLDGLRGVSIALVLVGHSIFGAPHSRLFRILFLHADLGVRIFFIISGFLITTLLLNERIESGGISLRLFYIRRALRILPAFFLFIGSIALLSFFGVTPVPAGAWVYVLTYTVNFAPFPPFPWVLVHLWSLSVEEQFYLLWPAVIKTCSRRTCIVIAVLAIFANPAVQAAEKFSKWTLPGWGPFPLVCGPLAMGCLLAMETPRIRRLMVCSKLLSSGWILVLTAALIAVLDIVPNRLGAISIALQIVQNSLLTLVIARLVFIPTGFAASILNSTPLVLSGKLSYSLYLWQQLFLSPVNRATVPISVQHCADRCSRFGFLLGRGDKIPGAAEKIPQASATFRVREGQGIASIEEL